MLRGKLHFVCQCNLNQLCGIHVTDGNADMLTSLCTNHQTLVGERTIQQVHLVESSSRLYTVNFAHQLLNFRLDVLTVDRGKSTVLALNCQLVDTLKHIMNFVQCTFCCLYTRDTVFCVQGSLRKTSDLTSHLLGNGETCCIICCAVNLVTGRQLLS